MPKQVVVIDRTRQQEDSRRSQKWVALVSAPIFFLIAGTLANAGREQASTAFALLALAMPAVFVGLLVRDWVVWVREEDKRD